MWMVVGVLSNEVYVYNFICQSEKSGFYHRESGEICWLQMGKVDVRRRCEKELRKMYEEWELLSCQCKPKKLKHASWLAGRKYSNDGNILILQLSWGALLSFQIDSKIHCKSIYKIELRKCTQDHPHNGIRTLPGLHWSVSPYSYLRIIIIALIGLAKRFIIPP